MVWSITYIRSFKEKTVGMHRMSATQTAIKDSYAKMLRRRCQLLNLNANGPFLTCIGERDSFPLMASKRFNSLEPVGSKDEGASVVDSETTWFDLDVCFEDNLRG